MEIELFAFEKRLNSTKIPDGTGTVFNGELKESFTLTGLSVTFDMQSPESVPLYNYAYIQAFSRYYFITDWSYTGGFWVASLAVDVLASNRLGIFASTQYVKRAYHTAVAIAKPVIIDDMYPTEGGAYTDSVTISQANFWGSGITSGIVVLGVVCSDTHSIGAVTYYAMEAPVFSAFMATMLNSISWANISANEISQELQKALINPTQYIVSCRWYPFTVYDISVGQGVIATNIIKLGWWSINISGVAYLIDDIQRSNIRRVSTVEIPKNRQAVLDHRDYLNFAPYTTYNLYFPPFGSFDLDTTILYGHSHLYITVETSLLTGDATFTLDVADNDGGTIISSGVPFMRYNSSMGVPLAIGAIAGDVGNYKNALVAGGVAGLSTLAGSL